MNITFNIELDHHINKRGERLLLIRCTQGKQHKRLNTGIYLFPEYWDGKKKEIKKSHSLAKELNDSLKKQVYLINKRYRDLLEEQGETTLGYLIDYLDKTKAASFYDFAIKYKLSQFKSNKKMGTYRRYEAVLNKLVEFAGKGLTIKQVTYSLLKDFEHHLLDVNKNGRDTVSSNLSVLRSILNEAVKHGLYDKRNPFDSISLKYTNNTKLKLTIEELKAFSKVDLPAIKSLHLARDFFMACFYAGGARGGDMVMMKWENIVEDRLVYKQKKTGKHLQLPLLNELQKIFEKYKNDGPFIFPLLIKNGDINDLGINSKLTYINKYLKEVCKYAGIFKKITTHCARHTFSDLSLGVNNNDIYGLKDVLGHSSVKTTELYLVNKNYSKSDIYLKAIFQLLE